MKKIILLSAIFITSLFFTTAALAFRCGEKLVRVKDLSFIVKKNCGEPDEKEHVGYTINKSSRREFKIEKWIYGPKNGRYYILTFIGGVLKKIDSIAVN